MTEEYLAQFHSVAPATFGSLVLATLIPAIVYFARRQGAYLLPDLNPGELEAFLIRAGLLVSTLVLMVRLTDIRLLTTSFVGISTSLVYSGWLLTKLCSLLALAFMVFGC